MYRNSGIPNLLIRFILFTLQMITYLGELTGYHIFTKGEQNIVVDESKECYAIMNTGMFHKQTHLCKTRKELWRKIKHNKDAKKLCQIFNRDFV